MNLFYFSEFFDILFVFLRFWNEKYLKKHRSREAAAGELGHLPELGQRHGARAAEKTNGAEKTTVARRRMGAAPRAENI